MQLAILLIMSLLLLGMGTAFAQETPQPPVKSVEDALRDVPYEDPDPYPVLIGDPSQNYSIPAIGELTVPYHFPYTITDFSKQFTRAQQEKVVADAFNVWKPYMNVNFVYVPDVDPKTVFCHIKMVDPTAGGLGHGGGNGPNTWCFAANGGGGRYIDVKDPNRVQFDLKSIMRHEIGHGLGMPHVSLRTQNCIMTPNIGTAIIPCKYEGSILAGIWKDAVCEIGTCMEGGAVQDAKVSFTSDKSQAELGDIVTLTMVITNTGNVDYASSEVILDRDGLNAIFLHRELFKTLKAGETKTIIIPWDTTNARISNHEIEAVFSPLSDDPTPSDNSVKININITNGTFTPPPPPPKTSAPVVESVTTINQTAISTTWTNEAFSPLFYIIINGVNTQNTWATPDKFQTITGLTPDTNYCIKIQALYDGSLPLTSTNEMCTTTDPVVIPLPPPVPCNVDCAQNKTLADHETRITILEGTKALSSNEITPDYINGIMAVVVVIGIIIAILLFNIGRKLNK